MNTPCWSLLEIPEFFCLSLQPHAYQLPAGLIVTFAQFCPEAQRNLLASFACKVQHAPLWVWGASRQPVPCGLPDLASQQPSLFPTCWGRAHILSTVLDIVRCCQSFHCLSEVNLLTNSRLARTNMTHAGRQTDKTRRQDIKMLNSAGLPSIIIRDCARCFNQCTVDGKKQKYAELSKQMRVAVCRLRLWDWHWQCEKDNVDGDGQALSVETILSELIKEEGVAGWPTISLLISVASNLTAVATRVGPSSKIVFR